MTQIEHDDDCVSKKPWGEVLSRSLKLFTFNVAREGGKSFGRVIFYIILGLILVGVATYIVDSMTGWFSGWFSFWPVNGAEAAEEVKWYCNWNPTC